MSAALVRRVRQRARVVPFVLLTLAIFPGTLGAEEAPPSPRTPAAESAVATDEDHILEDTTVVGRRRREAAPSSTYRLEMTRMQIIPRRNAAEHLMLAPGVLTTNHGGDGHAHETYMRGFAAGEGQEIEYLVDGVPLNEVSNAHGHGYSDLFFLPPEVVRVVTVQEGPFDPEQGDFAFAGTARYELGIEERGARMSYGFGRFDTHRTLLLYAPPGQDPGTFGGFEYQRSSGYGSNRASQRTSALGRYVHDPGQGLTRFAAAAFGYAARYDQAGVLREDDIASGRVGFFDTYDPNQGGESQRLLFSFELGAGPETARFDQTAFLGLRAMRLRANFTGWILDDPFDPEHGGAIVQRGDGREMRYSVVTAGSRGGYHLVFPWLNQNQRLSLGYSARFDHGSAKQLRLRSVTAIPYQRDFDREFSILNLSGWARGELRPLSWLALRGGVRIDTFAFGVTDLNHPTADREGRREADQSAQSFGIAINPRVTLDFRLLSGLNLITSYGQGTRSTEAAALSDNETAPFARSQQAEGGLVWHLGQGGDRFSLRVQGSYLFAKIDRDLLFSPEEGRNVLVGASTRHALLLSVRAVLDEWLEVLANLGYAHATLDDTRERIPYVPDLVARLDAVVSGRLFGWRLGSVPMHGRVGVGVTLVPGRPLPFGERGDPMYLINLGAQVRLWHVSLGLEIRNLLDRRYRQSEFHYASNFVSPEAPPARLPARHVVAGEPLFVMGSLTLHLEDLIRGRAHAD